MLVFLSAAFAATVYLNGVRADVLPEITMTNVTVKVDAKGDIYITAPGYKVEVAPPNPASSSGAAGTNPSATNTGAPTATYPTGTAAIPSAAVAVGTWWLVTEDNSSMGQIVDVAVNGVVVRRVQSGDPQTILDLAPYLRRGSNLIAMNAVQGATPPGGGILNIYIGRGSNVSGTIRIDAPEVRYSRRAVDPTSSGSRQFTVTIP